MAKKSGLKTKKTTVRKPFNSDEFETYCLVRLGAFSQLKRRLPLPLSELDKRYSRYFERN